MKNKIETIKGKISEKLISEGIIVDNVVFEKENNYNYLKVILDKTNGLDMDAIVLATNIINEILDELDLIDEEYILDVSSKERGN